MDPVESSALGGCEPLSASGYRSLTLGFVFMMFCAVACRAPKRVEAEGLKHYAFFNRERERIREPSFLDNPAFAGAQLKYTWRELEPQRGQYALEEMIRDEEYLARHGKGLVAQIQDVTFDTRYVPVPEYLRDDPEFGGGIARKFEVTGEGPSEVVREDGWVARRWDPLVQERYGALLREIAVALDGRLAAVVLPETAIDFGHDPARYPAGLTDAGYVDSVKALISAAGSAFEQTPVVLYANFMPGEWLPWEDKGYLRAVYKHAATVGVGVGGPDLRPHRKGQRQHSYPLIAARPAGLIAGVAVQEGNLADVDPETGRRVSPAELVAYATDELRLDYVFWGTQEPYYSEDVLPFLAEWERSRR